MYKNLDICTKFQKIIYLQIFKGEYIYKNIYIFLFEYVYIFLVINICWLPFFFLKNDWFFFSYFISYFILRNFIFPCLSIFQWGEDLHSAGRVSNEIFLKTKIEIMTTSSRSQNKSCNKWCKCMNVRMCAIFFIFDILDFFVSYWHLGRDAWVYWERMNIYTKSYDDLWECMYEMHSFHLC